ncbi:hypothetical protein SCLCIDRAFT_104685 [Scleroderma citrinum Foug A]|uniref:Uncharacterized protein n=1 Tax=Scleroderma citrinum Foug A TaxID=1036808 RepID=A0A0C3AUT5_9AGAM|nr:hypothetical protein SCLCIDRAFT_104685 [Scleroderma citrinum Foug A]
MPGLPSFIELMASLGLDSDINSRISACRSRSGSCSSVSSLGSSNRDHSPISSTFSLSSDVFPRDLDVDRRHPLTRSRAARYTPYMPATSLAKKISKTSLNDHKEDSHEASRNFSHFSSSPKLSSSPPRRRPSPLRFPNSEREDPASTPISSYLRRKTPQNSPTVATFTHRDPVERPETIALPSLISLQ